MPPGCEMVCTGSVLLGTPPAWFARVDSPIYNLQVQAQVDLEPSPREHGTRSSLFEDVEQGPKFMLFQTKVCIFVEVR